MKFQLKPVRASGNHLFLRLPLTPESPLAWWWGHPDRPDEARSGQLDAPEHITELPDEVRNSPVVVWLPAEQCLVEPVLFSGKSRLKPEQLALLLGDALGEDVSDWLWWRLPSGSTPLLAGCPKAWLEPVLTALFATGVQVTQILPELAALPPDQDVITYAGSRWLFREAGGRGAWLHPDWAEAILPTWRSPDTLTLYGAPPFANASWAAEHPQGGELLLARHSLASRINLLSQLPVDLQPRSQKRYWPYTLGLAIAAMLLFIATLLSAWQQQQKAIKDEQQMVALYQQWMPKDKRADVDVYERLRRQRRSLMQQFGSINFFNAFWQYGQLQRHWTQPQLQHLLFDRDKRSLIVQVSLQEADAKTLRDQASRAGIKLTFAAPQQGRVDATLTLRGPNAN